MQQVEARLDAMLEALRTIRVAMELREDWKESMPDRLRTIADEAIKEEERMRSVEPGQSC